MIPDYNAAIKKFVQMWVDKLSYRKLAKRCHISPGAIYGICLENRKASSDTLSKLEHYLQCELDVIRGLRPCLKNCPNCEMAQS